MRQEEFRKKGKPSEVFGRAYVERICRMYGDVYDDREEDSRIKGLDWVPGMKAGHKSMASYEDKICGVGKIS